MRNRAPKLEIKRIHIKHKNLGKPKKQTSVIIVCILAGILILGAVGILQLLNDNTVPSSAPEVIVGQAVATSDENEAPDIVESEQDESDYPSDIKTAYLTFDDGPSRVTPRILDTLKEKNVHATFFVVGNLAEEYPQTIQRMNEEGHQIANHSYSHVIKDVYASYAALKNQIDKTDHALKDIIGDDYIPGYFRCPQGSHSEHAKPYVDRLLDDGIRLFDWNALNGDSEGGTKNSNELIQTLKDTVADKKVVIILMHDAATKETTADTLDEAIEYLQDQGYEFRLIKEYGSEKGFF